MRMLAKAMVLVMVMALVAMAQYGAPPVAEKVELTAEQAKEVLVKVNDKTLTRGQAQIMIEIGAARSEVQAGQVWLDIQLLNEEFKRRKLDQTDRNKFVGNLICQYTFSNMLNEQWTKEVPEPNATDLKKYYEKNIDKYTIPTTANVQHISMQSNSAAKKVALQAKSGDDFDELYAKNCTESAKDRTNGKLNRMPVQRLELLLGKEACDAILKAKPGDVIGPFTGVRGFEIIKVESVTEGKVKKYEEVAQQVTAQFKNETIKSYIEMQKKALEQQAKIEKSELMKKLEKEAEEQAKNAPRGPGR
ncbi:MAG: peptidyl-prolyl cis-trans isomerase [Phycisphaerae bacterium]|nr:peptidyl-prolyl cis-trans isomerase [Phycisphaerae bacterium]